jgi:8-oxo-dGTP pyrophosphatase MutT (NUDIX family)
MASRLKAGRARAVLSSHGRRTRPAAGVLLRHTRDGETWWLLGKRHPSLGGSWSNLGGSLHVGEHPLVGALRELHEETRFPVAALQRAVIATVVEFPDDYRPYTLFVLDVPVAFVDGVLSWEHTDLAWFTTEAVDDMLLHPTADDLLYPKFAATWAALQKETAR